MSGRLSVTPSPPSAAGDPAPAGLWASGGEPGLTAVQHALDAAAECWRAAASARRGPYSGATPAKLELLAAAVEVMPEEGRELGAVLEDLGGLAVRHAVDPAHPFCAAHLHCAPLAAAVAADALVSAMNPSLDSWDQAPIAGHLEERVVAELARLAGLPATAGGVFTSGGTQSNLMALLLARDAAATGRRVAVDGLGPEAARQRVLCSQAAHFTVQRSASLLGLGSAAVETVAVDGDGRMRCDDLDERLRGLDARGLRAIALVATAGTTDLGAIDPLAELAERARTRGIWLHVDAAYGGAVLLSDRNRALLDGLELADSVAVDFHKLLWQPIACGALLLRDRARLEPLAVDVPYLNADGAEEGPWRMPDRLGPSLSTSRRFDALKLLIRDWYIFWRLKSPNASWLQSFLSWRGEI